MDLDSDFSLSPLKQTPAVSPPYKYENPNHCHSREQRSDYTISLAAFEGGVVSKLNQLLDFPHSLEKLMFSPPPLTHEDGGGKQVGNITTDIVEMPKEYVFYLDVPGIPKLDIQVTVEDERTLVIKSYGKRKREDSEDEGSKYIRLERSTPQKLMRKFRLPENADESALSARCENGVLTLTVVKKPPPTPKSKTVRVPFS